MINSKLQNEVRLQVLAANTLFSAEPSPWLADARWRKDNRKWLKKSQAIALQILNRLDEVQATKEDFAKLVEEPVEKVNLWLKGSTVFSEKDIKKIEAALAIKIAR